MLNMEQQEEFTDIGTVANESIHGSESPAASLAAADVDGGAVGNDDAPGSSDAGVPAERAAARSWVSPLQPPEDCIQVTPDGGVLKRVIKAGTGTEPSLHARCLVHYCGKLLSNGEVFMDSAQESNAGEPVAIVAGRDSAARESGLNLAVATMRLGEVAAVYVTDPRYGFGEKGSFSFPSVPPSSQLVYQVELVAWEGAEESERPLGLLYEERLEAAERRRLAGNALFKEGKAAEAASRYLSALSYLDEDFLFQLEGHYLDQAHAVKLPIHLNLAACQLQGGDYSAAVASCCQALSLEPNNPKALFRRGRARHLLGQTEAAIDDLTSAAKAAPQDAGIARELAAARATLKTEQRASAALFKGRLGPSPPAAPAAGAAAAAATGDSGDSGAAGTSGRGASGNAGSGKAAPGSEAGNVTGKRPASGAGSGSAGTAQQGGAGLLAALLLWAQALLGRLLRALGLVSLPMRRQAGS